MAELFKTENEKCTVLYTNHTKRKVLQRPTETSTTKLSIKANDRTEFSIINTIPSYSTVRTVKYLEARHKTI